MTVENEGSNPFEEEKITTLKPIPTPKPVKKSGNKWNKLDSQLINEIRSSMLFEASAKPDAEWDEPMKSPPVAPSPKSQVLKKIKEEMFKPESFKTDSLVEVAEEIPLSNEDDIELIRKSLVIQRSGERLRIIAVVIDREDHRSNELSSIRCGGDPLGCYAYNTVTDTYYITCMTYQDLGPISVSYRLQTAIGVESYSNNLIALPDEVVEKYLSPSQKKNLKSLREKYKSPRYSIHFMQSIIC